MKTLFKKSIAVLLVLVFTLSCFGFASFAATKETVRQYGAEGGYLAIGDSISRGCGAEGFYIDTDKAEGGQYDLFYLRNVQGAFPTLIADAVGCSMPDDITEQNATFWPLCYPGMTTAVLLDLLGIDDGFTDTALDYPYYDDMLQYFGFEGSLDGARGESITDGEIGQCGSVIDLIGKADLITVQLGMCDVFYRTYRIATNGGMLADGISLDLSSLDSIANLVSTAVKEMYFGFENWKANYPVLIEKIQAINPDATIVMVGAFNLLNQLTLTDDMILPLGSAISAITASMNQYFRKWEKKYGVTFCDISNTETLATESDWALLGDFMDNSFAGTHPSQKGYDYITRQILAVLPEKEQIKNIVVDLARFTTVDYVLVNGIPVKNYSMDGFNLSIPYSGPLATNLTIGVKGEDGKLAVQTYRLQYSIGEGYTAYRLYGNNDAVGTALKPFNNIINLFKQLFERISDGIRGLFDRG